MADKWTLAKRKALKFGAVAFLVGAAFGAALSIAGLGFVGAMVGTQAGLNLGLTADMASAMMNTELVAWVGGIGAAIGAGVFAAVGACTGAAYGAMIDENNPMPKTLEKTASFITQKVPSLANAVANKVNTEALSNAEREMLIRTHMMQQEAPAPVMEAAQAKQETPSSFHQDRLTSKSHAPELAVAQR